MEGNFKDGGQFARTHRNRVERKVLFLLQKNKQKPSPTLAGISANGDFPSTHTQIEL